MKCLAYQIMPVNILMKQNKAFDVDLHLLIIKEMKCLSISDYKIPDSANINILFT